MNETILKNNEIFQEENVEENYKMKNNDEKEYNENINTTKNIILYKNGDKYFPPKRFVINKRHIRTWDSFLEELTKTVQPRSGAIRDIRTPFHGTRIRSLDDLTLNGKYVAVPHGESMKLIDYTNVIDVSNPKNQIRKEFNRLKPITLTKNNDIKKIENKIRQQLYARGIVINVYKNGDPFTRAIKIVLNQFEQKHMSILVRAIEERVLLPSNRPIRRLYNMNGELIKFAKDVQDSEFYVAACNESFNNIKYGQFLPVIRGGKVPSSRLRIKYLNHSPTPVTNRIIGEGHPHHEQTHLMEKSNYNLDGSKNKTANNKQKKKTALKAEAASNIQAAFRGYLTRKEIDNAQENYSIIPITKYTYDPNKRKQKQGNKDQKIIYTKEIPREKKINRNENQKEQNNAKNKHTKPRQFNQNQSNKKQLAASTIQAGFRGYLIRKPYQKDNVKIPERILVERKNNMKSKQESEKKNEYKQTNTDKERPAVIIQSGFRAFKGRENLNKNIISQQQKEAEVKIQSGYRSYKTRKPLNKNDENIRRDAAVIIQAGYRAFVTRKKLNNIDESGKKNEAAIKVQSAFRAYKSRKLLGNINENEKRKEAAIKIQSGFRAHKSRNLISNFDQNEKRKEAAIIVQSGFRGYKSRKLLSENHESERKKEATIKIQSSYRGFKTRKQIKETKDIAMKENAAVKIQSSYRGFQTRKVITNDLNARLHAKTAEEQALERNKAASTIQSNFRGFKTRNEIER